ncbi:MAG: hypothetical protein ACREX3_08135 [Gammaproteobacteria bacterium]
MAAASLVRDKDSDVKEAAFRKVGNGMEYEFAFPYRNDDLGDSLWQIGRAYQLAILVGPGEEFQAINENTWMSDQIYIRLGSRSQESIYQPPYLAGRETVDHGEHSQGGEHEQKGKKR